MGTAIEPGWKHSSNLAGSNVAPGRNKHRRWLEKRSHPAGTALRTRLAELSHPVGRNVAPGWKRL